MKRHYLSILIAGAGGVMVPPKTYFAKIQAVLKQHDVLLVADEVICGFGRTGNMWGCDTYDIRPDLLTANPGAAPDPGLSVRSARPGEALPPAWDGKPSVTVRLRVGAPSRLTVDRGGITFDVASAASLPGDGPALPKSLESPD